MLVLRCFVDRNFDLIFFRKILRPRIKPEYFTKFDLRQLCFEMQILYMYSFVFYSKHRKQANTHVAV